MKNDELSLRSYVIFDRGMQELLDAGATVELVSLAKDGGNEVDGYFIILHHPDGEGSYLLVTTNNPKAKLVSAPKSVLKMFEGTGQKTIVFPVEPMIKTPREIWAYHDKLNDRSDKE